MSPDESARNMAMLNWFRFHPATAVTGPIHDQIRVGYRKLAEKMLELLPEGPDRTLALRKLQDAMMAANACVANAQPEDAPALNEHSGKTDIVLQALGLAAGTALRTTLGAPQERPGASQEGG